MKSLKEVSKEKDDDREYSSQFIPQIIEWAEKLSTAFPLNQCKEEFKTVSRDHLKIACDLLVESNAVQRVEKGRLITYLYLPGKRFKKMKIFISH